jgi:hypothetical protein
VSPTSRKYVLDTQIFIDAFRDPTTIEAPAFSDWIAISSSSYGNSLMAFSTASASVRASTARFA